MTALRAFSSLKSFERLKSSGVSEEQARIFVDIFEQVASSSVEHLAAKEDLALTESRLENKITKEISGLDQKLSGKIDALDQRLSAKIDEVDQKLSAKIDGVDQRLSGKIDEVKAQIFEVKEEMSGIKATNNLLIKFFLGAFILIVINIAVALLHVA